MSTTQLWPASGWDTARRRPLSCVISARMPVRLASEGADESVDQFLTLDGADPGEDGEPRVQRQAEPARGRLDLEALVPHLSSSERSATNLERGCGRTSDVRIGEPVSTTANLDGLAAWKARPLSSVGRAQPW